MEKPPSIINVESEANKEKEKKRGAWEIVEGIALGGMIGASVIGGEAARELMQPHINNSEITDNLNEINRKPGETTIKEFVSLGVGDKVYRAEIDSGIKLKDFKGSGMTPNHKGILNYADKMIAEVDNEDGSKVAVLFKIVPEGMQITYQRINAHGKVLSERVSYLTPAKPNVFEQK